MMTGNAELKEAGRKEEARRWIMQARFDLKAAAWNLEDFYRSQDFNIGD